MVYKIKVGGKGRAVLPAALRTEAHIEEGDTLIGRIENGRLVIETRQAVKDRIRSAAREAAGGSGQVVDRLLAERREEAERPARPSNPA